MILRHAEQVTASAQSVKLQPSRAVFPLDVWPAQRKRFADGPTK